jgi:hypothetical protein
MTKTKIAFFAIPALAAVLIGAMILPAYSQEVKQEFHLATLEVAMDIKPTSCPNSINPNQKGLISVAIVGGATYDEKRDLDVLTIDLSTLKLNLKSSETKLESSEAKLESSELEELKQRISYEDVTSPYTGDKRDVDDCSTDGPDGVLDLVIKVETRALAAALQKGDSATLQITADLKIDGQETIHITAEDMIRKVGNTPPLRVIIPGPGK